MVASINKSINNNNVMGNIIMNLKQANLGYDIQKESSIIKKSRVWSRYLYQFE